MARRYRGTRRVKRNRKAKGKKSMIKKVVRRQLQAVGLSRPEIKHYYLYIPDVTLSNNLATTPIYYLQPSRQGDNGLILNNTIYPGGTTGGMIEGNSYICKFLNIMINSYNSDPAAPHWLRAIIVEDMNPMSDQDLKPYNTGASTTDGSNLFLVNNIHSYYVPNNKRFKILYDTTRLLPTAGEYNKNPQLIKKRINLHNARITNIPTDNTEVLQASNRQYILFMFSDTSTYVAVDLHTHMGITDV